MSGRDAFPPALLGRRVAVEPDIYGAPSPAPDSPAGVVPGVLRVAALIIVVLTFAMVVEQRATVVIALVAVVAAAYGLHRFGVRVRAAYPGQAAPPEAAWTRSRKGWELNGWNRTLFAGFHVVLVPCICGLVVASGSQQLAAVIVPVVLVVLGALAVPSFLLNWWRGGLRIEWMEFPMRTGSTAAFRIFRTGGSDGLAEVRTRLRCVTWRRRWLRAPERVELAAFAWESEHVVTASAEEPVVVGFEIPARLPGTSTDEDRSVSWELLVAVIAGDVTLRANVHVPIFAPAAPVQSAPQD